MTARNRLEEALAANTAGDRRAAIVAMHRAAGEDPNGPAYPDILEALAAANAGQLEVVTLSIRAGLDAIDLAEREVEPPAPAPGDVALFWRASGRRFRIRNRSVTAEVRWVLEQRLPGLAWEPVGGVAAEVADEVRRLSAPARALRADGATKALEVARRAWDAAIARGAEPLEAWAEAQAAVVDRLQEYSGGGAGQ